MARNHGDGGISSYETKNGTRHSIVFRELNPQTGRKRQRREGGFTTKRAAQIALRKRLSRIERGEHVSSSTLTLRAFAVDTWLPSKRREGLAESTLASYSNMLRLHVLPSFGDRPLQKVTASDLDALYTRLLADGSCRKPLASRSVQYVHTILSGMFKHAVRLGLLLRNPIAPATPPGRGDRHAGLRAWTPVQARLFLSLIDEEPLGPLWSLMLSTGLRRGEALGLRWCDVDEQALTLAVRQQVVIDPRTFKAIVSPSLKTKRFRRTIAVDERLIARLRAHRVTQAQVRLLVGAGRRDHDLVFCTAAGSPLRPDSATGEWSRLAVRLSGEHGLPRLRLHDMRHTFATLALLSGTPMKVLSEMLGHASITTTYDTYAHVLPEMQADASQRVANAVFGVV